MPHAQEACQGFSNQCVVCFGENIGNDRKGYNDRNLNNSEPDRSDRQFARECLRKRRCEKDSIMLTSSNESSVEVSPLIVEAETFNVVASHGPNFGIMDTGATKTVMGSNLIKPFLDNLNEEVRKKVRRSNCQITFRFGNLQTLDSTQALVIPIGHLHLKIAIVPGNTPFLLSNTLLRALKAATDFHNHVLISPMLDQAIPLVLSAKGLFLIDMNLLTDVARSMDGRIIRETFTLTDIPAGKFANPEGPMKVTVESKVLTGSENERDSECLKVNSVECTRSCEAARNSVFESAAVEPSVQISETSSPTFRRATICDHVSDRPPQEDSSAQHGALGGCDQVQPASTGEHEDGFRSGSSWKDFRNDVVRPPELDQVVHRTLPEQSQMGAPQDDALHRTQDRKARTGRNNRSSADGRGHEEEGQTSVYNTGTQEDVSCQDNGQEHGQSNAHQVRDHGGIGRTLGGSRHRGAEHCPVGATGDPGRNSDHAIPNAQHRECAADHREPSSELCHHARAEGRLLSESPEWHLIHAGDGDQDCHDCIQQSVSETSDRNRFNKLVRQLTMELEECARKCPDTPKSQSMLFEVFCSRNSQLTQQCVNLGNQAHRFGYDQGNLHEIDGRRNLFEALVQHRPRHLWFSPECGPWCAFSELNASKSPQAFELIRNRRRLHIVDLALGVVLLRFQIQNRNHFHWEQPSRSLMFRNPLVKEMLEKTQCAQFDMCVMGDLQDPMSGVRMKKGLQVMTTSRKMFQHLHGHTCPGNHEHQQIEGSTWFQGQSISRTKFTERYPRKFARNVARVMNHDLCSIPFVLEHCFVNLDVDNPRVHKCPRRTDTRAKASVPPAIEPAELPELKRRRIVEKGSDHSVNLTEKWKVIVDKVDHLTPRVGKKVIRDNEIINCFQELLPDKEVQFAIVCRGTDRALGPGKDVVLGEAPFRRCVFKHRTTDAIMIEESWELWEQLSQARIQRKGHPCRLNITPFARNPLEGESDIARNPSQSSEVPRTETLPTDSVPIPEEKFESPISGDMTSSESNLPNPQVIDLQSVNHGPHFLQLSKTDQQELIRAHKNLGHPSNEKLSLLLKQQGCSSELSTGVLDLKCSVCHMQARPKHSRPGTIKECLDFNDRIAIDGLKFTNSQGQIFHIYHIIDMATNFHVAMIAPSRTVDSLIQCVIQMWLCWAGPPCEIIMDSATEFVSEGFAQFLQSHNIRSVTVPPEGHWQNGRSERHGAILEEIIRKMDIELPISSYSDLQKVLWHATQAKNSCGLRKGYSPETLVFGKAARLPGSLSGDDLLPAHALADSETAQGVSFREQLSLRESARRAFHSADNNAALRRAVLRRSCPHRGTYQAGEWVMCWKSNVNQKGWFGPLQVVTQEGNRVVWLTQGDKLYRSPPEMCRPVSAYEARMINSSSPSESLRTALSQVSQISSNLPEGPSPPNLGSGLEVIQEAPQIPNLPNPQVIPIEPEQSTPSQPDQEPEIPPSPIGSIGNDDTNLPPVDGIGVPVPGSSDEEANCVGYHCVDEYPCFHVAGKHQAWRFEIEIGDKEICQWKQEDNPCDMAFVVSAAKKQRSEVHLSDLSPEEWQEFQDAKGSEIQNWLKTGTVIKMLRNQLAPEEILRCRWVLTWKPIEASDRDPSQPQKVNKAKARLVVLGYLDPNLENIPRDSPTLGRHSKMLLLQLVSSCSWTLRSFDIKAAFLQGKPQDDRIIGLEPCPELVDALSLKPGEICRLVKGAYGLIDAPFLWYQALSQELLSLGFEIAPFDPCLFVLRHPETQRPRGVIGIHVDDGLCGGDEVFLEHLDRLQKKYPFGSAKIGSFTFTGVNLQQRGDKSIVMSQSEYVRKISSISISQHRRDIPTEKFTEAERQQLRALVGSLQYAAVNTRPDIASRLSMIQSQINQATVQTLLEGNKVLHETRRHHDVSIVIQPIACDDFRFLAFSDASFASRSNPDSHAGAIILGTHKDISKNVSCPISPLSWGCRKIQKVVTSTLSAETMALSSALDQLSWLKLFWGWILNPAVKWRNPEEALKELPEAISTSPFRVPEESDVATIDCKSLFDLISRTAMPNCQEFRTQLQARAIKDFLQEGTSLRWVHSGAQLADALTKVMENSFLRETLAVGKYRLHDEQATLKQRACNRNRLRWLRDGCTEAETIPSSDRQI